MRFQFRLCCRLTLITIFFLTACAQLPKTNSTSHNDLLIQGRLSLQIDSSPSQVLFAPFEMRGSASKGQIDIYSPLGSILAQAMWDSEQAVLINGQRRQVFANMNDLEQKLLGTPISLPEVIQFYQSKSITPVLKGWVVKRETPERLVLDRNEPLPHIQLKIQIDSDVSQPSPNR
ncbi:MAG: hypothetical protein EBT78_02430 [Betaproteobacteria bacterium]|jgi:outer membrane lipoprotein LolB|nr:hypothetical protein [Betaproteobacteria bacterium]NBT66602.1 hypothetical protein [Betaproteobacteria bacterium]NBY06496.1 hypothetical protein [Betaproteobacteria bacterium]